MKKNVLFFTVILLITTLNMKAQNDSIYLWKSGHVIVKQSIKPADLDTIMFRKFHVVNLPNVTICNQVWSSTNLDVTTYSDGTPILEVSSDNLTSAGIGAFCSLGPALGKLYNYKAVLGIYNAASENNPNLRKKLAPNGWHIPSDAEWTTLTTCLGSTASNKMLEVNSLYWAPSVLVGANNSSGFSARGAGYITGNGYGGIYYRARFWSSTQYIPPSISAYTYAYGRELPVTNFAQGVQRAYYITSHGYSVRCIRDY